MWKEKVYTGQITLGTGTTTITKFPDSTTITVNISKTDKLNDCIKSFLLECGVPSVVYYPCSGSDSRKGNLYINGVPFQFYVSGSNYYWNAYSGNSLSFYTSSGAVIFDSSGNYSIRLCLAGNPLSTFGFALAGSSAYGSTAYPINYIMMYKLKSAVDDSIWYFTQMNGQTTSGLWLTKSDGTRPYNNYLQTGLVNPTQYNIVPQIMNLFPNKYPLIPKYYAFFRMVDCYEFVSYYELGSLQSSPADSKFVTIGSNVYFVNNYSATGVLIDCGAA